MLLLFLDTETTGVDFAKCQIIEIGTILYDLDPATLNLRPISHFQSTVALRQSLDERISRITGITEQELSTASNYLIVQNSWANWLESNLKDQKLEAVVGHSIDFDITFLKKEGWFLPDCSHIDTLDLSKILLPYTSAVNLEFLAKKFNLEHQNDLVDLNLDQISHHRSIFDCVMSKNLFELLLTKLTNSSFSDNFVDKIRDNFVHLPLRFYSDKQPKQTLDQNLGIKNENKSTSKTIQINLDGSIKKDTISNRIIQLNQQTLGILELALDYAWDNDNRLIMYQLCAINYYHLQGLQYLRLHTKGFSYLATTILDWLDSMTQSESQNQNCDSQILPNLERIIENTSQILDNQCNFGQIVELLEIWQQLLGDNKDSKIQKILNQYDFLLVSVQATMENYSIKLDLDNPQYRQKSVAQKLKNLIELIQDLQLESRVRKSELPEVLSKNTGNNSSNQSDILISILATKINNQLQFLQSNSSQIQLKLNVKSLILTQNKTTDYTIQKHFDDIINHNPDIKLTINLDQTSTNSLLIAANLNLPSDSLQCLNDNYQFQVDKSITTESFLTDNIQLAKSSNKPILILCGLNSSINNLAKTGSESSLMDNVLIVGESGGITKIGSKIENGFVGVVVVKFNSLDFFVNSKSVKSFGQVILYDRPYFLMHNYWFNQSKLSQDPDQFLINLKNIYLQSKINYIHQVFCCPVRFAFNLLK